MAEAGHANNSRDHETPSPAYVRDTTRSQATAADTAPQTTPRAPEPRALRDWKWRDDADATNNPCHKGDGRAGTGYVNLHKGDLVWTGRCSGPAPTARSDGIPWRFGLNLQTAKSGWFPCTFAVKPANQFLFPIREPREDSSTPNAHTNDAATKAQDHPPLSRGTLSEL